MVQALSCVLDGGKWSASSFSHFNPGERQTRQYHWADSASLRFRSDHLSLLKADSIWQRQCWDSFCDDRLTDWLPNVAVSWLAPLLRIRRGSHWVRISARASTDRGICGLPYLIKENAGKVAENSPRSFPSKSFPIDHSHITLHS
jgi:hypothetical protein